MLLQLLWLGRLVKEVGEGRRHCFWRRGRGLWSLIPQRFLIKLCRSLKLCLVFEEHVLQVFAASAVKAGLACVENCERTLLTIIDVFQGRFEGVEKILFAHLETFSLKFGGHLHWLKGNKQLRTTFLCSSPYSPFHLLATKSYHP